MQNNTYFGRLYDQISVTYINVCDRTVSSLTHIDMYRNSVRTSVNTEAAVPCILSVKFCKSGDNGGT